MEEVSTVPQQEPAVFRRIGAEGCKQRTTAGLKQACTHYGIFLLQSGVIQDEDHDWLNDAQLESVIVNKVTFQRYADYLARFALSLRDQSLLSEDTALQYLSGAKEVIRRKYENDPIWKDHDSSPNTISSNRNMPWYTKLRLGLSKVVIDRA